MNSISCTKGGLGLLPASLALLVVAALALPPRVSSQSNPALPISLSHRYLLLIETSRTMSHRSQGMSAAIEEILDSGLKAEGRPGDTLTVWTFGADVQKNLFPQVELPLDTRPGFGGQLISFVQNQPSGQKVSFDAVMPDLNALIRQTDFTTVILISAGESEMRGTPFDAQVNQAYRRWQDEQKKSRMPLVTVLRAGHGKFTHWSVTPAQWPLELPPFPMELKFVPGKSSKPAELPGTVKETPPSQWASTSVKANPPAPSPKAANPTTTLVASPAKPAPVTPSNPPANKLSAPLSPPANALAGNENPKPKPSVAPTQPKPPEIALAAWQPFDEPLPAWLTHDDLPASPLAALPEIKTQLPLAKIVSAKAPALKTTETKLEGWQPLDEALPGWVPAAESNSLVSSVPDPRPHLVASAGVRSSSSAATSELKNGQLSAGAPSNPTVEPAGQPASAGVRSSSSAATSELKNGRLSTGAPSNPTVVRARQLASTMADAHLSIAPEELTGSVAQSKPALVSPAPTAFIPEARPGFLRENAAYLVMLLLAGVAANFCFLNWFRSYLSPLLTRPASAGPAFAIITAPEKRHPVHEDTAPSDPPIVQKPNRLPALVVAEAGRR